MYLCPDHMSNMHANLNQKEERKARKWDITVIACDMCLHTRVTTMIPLLIQNSLSSHGNFSHKMFYNM